MTEIFFTRQCDNNFGETKPFGAPVQIYYGHSVQVSLQFARFRPPPRFGGKTFLYARPAAFEIFAAVGIQPKHFSQCGLANSGSQSTTWHRNMAEHWSHEEVEATVSDYFEMLAMELRGEPYNKAEHNRNLQKLLKSRTKAAVELKHQNISAALTELGYPYIDGYKPLPKYQRLLYEVVEDRLLNAVGLHQAAAAAVEQTVEQLPVVSDVLAILVSPPHREEDKPKLHDSAPRIRQPVRRNYLEIESRNQALGLAGEKLVLEF